MPSTKLQTRNILHRYFPCIYDIKCDANYNDNSLLLIPPPLHLRYLMRTCDDLRGGLNSIAVQLGMERIHGPAHQARVTRRVALRLSSAHAVQAGSDSLLTAKVFYEMRRRYFEGEARVSRAVAAAAMAVAPHTHASALRLTCYMQVLQLQIRSFYSVQARSTTASTSACYSGWVKAASPRPCLGARSDA